MSATGRLIDGTELPIYDLFVGLNSYGLVVNLITTFSRDLSWFLFFVARYDRLLDDVSESPLVQQLGDEDHASIGLFVARSSLNIGSRRIDRVPHPLRLL
jgi:hypothetical protein